MVPNQLSPEHFRAYPPKAKHEAESQLGLLRRLPLSFAPLLLRELIVLDWKFPAERRDIDRQFKFLAGLSAPAFSNAMEAFSRLRISSDLERVDWVNSPADFSEKLTAYLWSTHQIDAFRAAAVDYVAQSSTLSADDKLPIHRLGIVVIGQGNAGTKYPLFQKLAPHGTLFTRVEHSDGMRVLLDVVNKRSARHPEPYSHWCIDGAEAHGTEALVTQISYGALSPIRAALQRQMQKSYEGGTFNPETFRTNLARTRTEEIGLDAGLDPVLNRFQLSILTEGSGTQVFATTFVQWTAREALRRAQPLTLFARFTPRQRERPMNELLAEAQRPPELDPAGSLIDADLGAYYTWMNQQRLSGAEDAAFLVWFEDHEQAMVIAPSVARGARVDSAVRLSDLVERIA